MATAAQVETEKARAECKAAAFKVVEDIKLDFSEDIVALQYRCDNIADTVQSLQTPPERSFTPFRLTYKPGQLEWITLAECNNDLSLFTRLFMVMFSVGCTVAKHLVHRKQAIFSSNFFNLNRTTALELQPMRYRGAGSTGSCILWRTLQL